jgi:hypothetical protein
MSWERSVTYVSGPDNGKLGARGSRAVTLLCPAGTFGSKVCVDCNLKFPVYQGKIQGISDSKQSTTLSSQQITSATSARCEQISCKREQKRSGNLFSVTGKSKLQNRELLPKYYTDVPTSGTGSIHTSRLECAPFRDSAKLGTSTALIKFSGPRIKRAQERELQPGF